MLRLIKYALAALAFPMALAAQDPLVSLERLDQVRDWRAVGLLQIGQFGSCTGTLIEPDLVLTAAHCLVDEAGDLHAPSTIVFRAAFQNGRQAAAVRAMSTAIPDDYDRNGDRVREGFAVDLGLIRLTTPILRTQVAPFRVVDLIAGDDELAVVSYGQGRNEAPSLQRVCNLLGRRQGMVVMDCDATFGSSGAPVFVLRDGGPRIASVLTGTFESNGSQYSIGVQLNQLLPMLRRKLSGLGGQVGTPSGASVTIVRPGERSDTGARFVQVGD